MSCGVDSLDKVMHMERSNHCSVLFVQNDGAPTPLFQSLQLDASQHPLDLPALGI